MKLIFTRHGETEWNRLRKTQGATDTTLTDRGREQARLLAERLRGQRIDVIYSSSLSRAMETAKIIAHEVSAPVISEPDLMEYGFGSWEGMHIDSLRDDFPEIFSAWDSSPAQCEIPGAEHFPSYSARVRNFLEKALSRHENGTVMAVSHQLTSKLIITNALGISENGIHSFRVDNASLNMLNFSRHVVLEKLNDITHLLGERK